MTALRWEVGEPPEAFVDFCAGALPEVYGYLVARCGDRATAEDLTSATFEAAVSAVRRATVTDLSTGWLIVVARRRLIDHWRREERDAKRLEAFACDEIDTPGDGWNDTID